MRGIKRINKGFSLVEVVISVAILVLLLIPIASITMSTIKTNKQAEQKQKATFLGEKLLEEIKSYDTMTIKNETQLDGTTKEVIELLNSEKLEVVRYSPSSPNNNEIKELKVLNAVSFGVTDEKGVEYHIKLKLTRDLDASYKDSVSNNIVENDYKQKLYFYSGATAPKVGVEENSDGTPAGTQYDINNLNEKLVLRINSSMGITLVKNIGGSETILMSRSADAGVSLNKILIKLDENFIGFSGNPVVNLYIESDYLYPITIDTIKENKPTGSVEIKTESPDGINRIKDKITISNNSSTYVATHLGDLYKIEVEVAKKDGESLVTMDGTKNIVISH